MIANYHTHTTRCHHASGTEEEYICSAIDAGCQILGFSDHAPHPYPDGYVSRIRMLPEELSDYTDTLCTLRQKYARQIRLHIGLEAEYYPGLFSEFKHMLLDQPVEYLILGQHWCGNEVNEVYVGRPTEDSQMLSRYVDQVLAALDTGAFSYVAHPDVLHFVGDAKTYEHHIRNLCKGVASRDFPLEINLLGLRNSAHYPNPAFWRVAAEENCRCVLGVDAHQPDQFLDQTPEQKARAFAEELGLRLESSVSLQRISR